MSRECPQNKKAAVVIPNAATVVVVQMSTLYATGHLSIHDRIEGIRFHCFHFDTGINLIVDFSDHSPERKQKQMIDFTDLKKTLNRIHTNLQLPGLFQVQMNHVWTRISLTSTLNIMRRHMQLRLLFCMLLVTIKTCISCSLSTVVTDFLKETIQS